MSKQNVFLIIIVALIAAGVIGYAFYSEQLRATETAIATQLQEQERRVFRMAELVDGNRSETPISAAVSDCGDGERRRLDSLLGGLQSLSATDLTELRTLFRQCGSYFADLYEVNVAQLEREIEFYAALTQLHQRVAGTPANEQLTRWRDLLSTEKARSQTTQELVEIQREIINLLRSGKSVESDAVTELVAEGQNARETLEVLNEQSDTLRSTIGSRI